MFEEPQDLAADLGGIAEQRDGPVRPIGAIGCIRFGGLALVLFLQRFLIGDAMLSHRGVKQDRNQDTGNDGQADLVLDGDGALAPRLGLGEVVLPGIEALFNTPALEPL